MHKDVLISRFGRRSDTVGRCIRCFYLALTDGKHSAAGDERNAEEVRHAMHQWHEAVVESTGLDLKRLQRNLEPLARRCGIDSLQEPEQLLFAAQSVFAVVVKLLIWRIASHESERPIRQILLDEFFFFNALEHGDLFQELGWPLIGSGDSFAWYTQCWSTSMSDCLRPIRELAMTVEPGQLLADASSGHDLLAVLYQDVFDRKIRQALGEFYTPGALADCLLDRAGYHGDTSQRILDPTCGSGTFLIKAIRRMLDDGRHDAATIVRCVVGVDLNPIAVLMARASYVLALGHLARDLGSCEIPIYQADMLLDEERLPPGPFDLIIGNPPWVTWDNLPTSYRERTEPLWRKHGLFTLSGNEARHGGGKKDLAMLVIMQATDRWLDTGGRLAMVVTQTMFQTRAAGDGFRRFRIADSGEPLKVLGVDDLVDLKPFRDASNHTALLLLEKGRPTEYPVAYSLWKCETPAKVNKRTLAERMSSSQQIACHARPVDADSPGAPWIVVPAELECSLDRMTGPSDYRAHLGANSGGANGVYWVELLDDSDGETVKVRNMPGRGKQAVKRVTCEIERELLYPLIRWGDIGPYRSDASAYLLLVQDPASRRGIDLEVMREKYPFALAYLQRFEPMLRARAAYRRYQQTAPFYSMYNVGSYTVAPVKVVWRRMDRRVSAAVVTPTDDPIRGRIAPLPQETCVLVETHCNTEAHYLAAVMNSAVVHFLVTSHSVKGGKGFGSPGMLEYLRVRKFDATDAAHCELSDLSRLMHQTEARKTKADHRAAAEQAETSTAQDRIDELTGQLWGLTPVQLAKLKAIG